MDKAFTFFITSDTGSQVRKFTISRLALILFVSFTLSLFGYSVFIVKDYYSLKNGQVGTDELKEKVKLQQNEIINQRTCREGAAIKCQGAEAIQCGGAANIKCFQAI